VDIVGQVRLYVGTAITSPRVSLFATWVEKREETATDSKFRRPGFKFDRKRIRVFSNISSGLFATGSIKHLSKLNSRAQ
jgi:hypothetical protein